MTPISAHLVRLVFLSAAVDSPLTSGLLPYLGVTQYNKDLRQSYYALLPPNPPLPNTYLGLILLWFLGLLSLSNVQLSLILAPNEHLH